MKKPKIDADKMIMNTLNSFEKFGVSGIQIGNTTYKKKGENILEITTKKKVKTKGKRGIKQCQQNSSK